MTTTNFIDDCQQRIEAKLEQFLPSASTTPVVLHQAMRYAVLDGGKRIRPLLVYATGRFLGASLATLDNAAMAVELIHCYSLVHDDLPAMDNDDLRRGKPTCHKVYGEAMAMLAGDALQAEAFALLAQHAALDTAVQLKCVELLGAACGSRGMAGGQAIDLAAVGKTLTQSELELMHRLKTGALIKASVLLGAAIGGADATQWENLTEFSTHLGFAFQIQDDIFDVEGSTEQLGKQQGADAARAKPTYPAILGMVKSKALVDTVFKNALASLAKCGEAADDLRAVANYIVQRQH